MEYVCEIIITANPQADRFVPSGFVNSSFRGAICLFSVATFVNPEDCKRAGDDKTSSKISKLRGGCSFPYLYLGTSKFSSKKPISMYLNISSSVNIVPFFKRFINSSYSFFRSINASYSSLSCSTLAITSEIPITEQIQDIVGAMFDSNTETRITASYQDSDGTIDLVVDNDLSNYDNIQWLENTTPIAKDVLDAKVVELQTALDNEEQSKADLKASAKAKLIAGEPLTEEEADTIVL